LNPNTNNAILESYKIGSDAYYKSETIYTSRENFFLAAKSLLAIAAVDLYLSDKVGIIRFIVPFIGIGVSVIWYLMQEKSSKFSWKRKQYLKQIEEELPVKFFTESDVTSSCCLSTWTLRKLLPLLFLIFWISFVLLIYFNW